MSKKQNHPNEKSDALDRALKATAAAIEDTIDSFIEKTEGPEGRLIDAMRYSVLAGGKRLRPFLVVSSAELFGVSRERAFRVGAAIECIHTYSLIHDDLPCMDDDDLRRGKPTLHKAFDEATAVLAGDALLTLAFEILAAEETHSDARVRAELVLAIANASGQFGMVGGQMIDLEAENKKLDIGSITRLQQMKTGALIAVSTEAGAIMGHANAESRTALKNYAHDLGLAFQIVDDLLDENGDPVKLGKSVGKDATAGKATFVSILGEERARTQAEMLAEQSIRHLDIFDDKADLLRAVSFFVLNRSY